MAKSKVKRPTWFKVFLSAKSTIDAIPNENVGIGLKAAFEYFETKTEPSLDPLSKVVFCAMRPYIDEAFSDYQRSVDNGIKGAGIKHGKDHVTITPIQVDCSDDDCPF